MRKTKWDRNDIQFPRLLSELRAIGLSAMQYRNLGLSMDLDRKDIDILLERAEYEWCVAKYGKRAAKKLMKEGV